jgi:poly(A) polymerase
MIVRDNVFGNVEQDAWRRDFTVNALYYNIEDFSVVDYTNGLPDLRQGLLRTIGDPLLRFREDPVRMLRAIRFAAKLGFKLDPAAEHAIGELRDAMEQVPPARLFDEVLKLFMSGYAVATFELLRHYHLFECLFPGVEASLAVEREGFPLTLLMRGLANTDKRIQEGKSVTPAFLFAVLLWEPVRLRAEQLRASAGSEFDALHQAASEVLVEQGQRISIPKRFSVQSKEIWSLQPRLNSLSGRRPLRALSHPRFRAGYDFLLLRAECGEAPEDLGQWWTEFQYKDEQGREAMLSALRETQRAPRRRRKRGRSASNPPLAP